MLFYLRALTLVGHSDGCILNTVILELLIVCVCLLLPTKCMYGLGADGTAVNTGQRNGIMAKLKDYVTHEKRIIGVWCLAHKIELAVKRA